jgi:hypothetical protein
MTIGGLFCLERCIPALIGVSELTCCLRVTCFAYEQQVCKIETQDQGKRADYFYPSASARRSVPVDRTITRRDERFGPSRGVEWLAASGQVARATPKKGRAVWDSFGRSKFTPGPYRSQPAGNRQARRRRIGGGLTTPRNQPAFASRSFAPSRPSAQRGPRAGVTTPALAARFRLAGCLACGTVALASVIGGEGSCKVCHAGLVEILGGPPLRRTG